MNIKNLLGFYHPNYIVTLVYMLQASEYDLKNYLKWYWRTTDLATVSYRGELKFTRKAQLLTVIATLLTSAQLILGFYLIANHGTDRIDMTALGVSILLLMPVATAHLMALPLIFGTWVVQKPKTDSMLRDAHKIFADHPGVIMVVAGSYGKTTTKETLKTVLGSQLKVAATPANLNTPIAIVDFAESLDGDEEVLIVELGEFEPGDIQNFAEMIQPDAAVITGLTEAHLDTLGSLDEAANNLLTLAQFVPSEALFINTDSDKLTDYTADIEHVPYNNKGALGWKVSKPKSSLEGTTLTVKKGKTSIDAESQIIGEHMVGMLAFAIAIAKEFKVKKSNIEKGVKETKAFDHRMQLTRNDDVHVIDDTYNGNIEGVKAGVEFVRTQKAKRKVYITPGLVEMGDKAADVNRELGEVVAPVFDLVVLMKNAQTDDIVEGLHAAGFSGEQQIIDEPLEFYQNLESFVSDGDLVLMQNDLPDNYA